MTRMANNIESQVNPPLWLIMHSVIAVVTEILRSVRSSLANPSPATRRHHRSMTAKPRVPPIRCHCEMSVGVGTAPRNPPAHYAEVG